VQSIVDATYVSNEIYDLVVDNSLGVNLNTDFSVSNNLTINTGKLLTISISNKLLVQGTVTNNAGVNGLVIKASSVAPNGSFVFYNSSGNPVPATVEMYTKAAASNYNPGTGVYSGYKWQYFGVPVSKVQANPTFYGSYVRKWVESGTTISNHWVQLQNADSVYAFLGYEITQPVGTSIVFQGYLVNSNYASGQLPYTSSALYPGQQILANPYLGAIDITQMNFGSEMEWTVYLYNTGSYTDWTTNNGETTTGNNPGQYTAIPKNLAGSLGLPAQIPTMQAFLVKAMSNSANATLSIPYSSAIVKNTDLQRGPTKIGNRTVSELTSTLIEVKGARFSDRMWLFSRSGCTHNFDNGWDGIKNYSSSPLVPQIFNSEADNDYQINTVDDINNTKIGFYSGEDSVYTLTFTHQNVESIYPTLYLVDLQNDSIVDIVESGTEYTFVVHSTDTLVNRFKIVSHKDLPTVTQQVNDRKLKVFSNGKTVFVYNSTETKGDLFLYDISGRVVLEKSFDANSHTLINQNLPAGVYTTKVMLGEIKTISRVILK